MIRLLGGHQAAENQPGEAALQGSFHPRQLLVLVEGVEVDPSLLRKHQRKERENGLLRRLDFKNVTVVESY